MNIQSSLKVLGTGLGLIARHVESKMTFEAQLGEASHWGVLFLLLLSLSPNGIANFM